MVVVVGADVHKRSHTFVAVDPAGRRLGQLTVKADAQGHDKAVRWAESTFGTDLRWGVEDCRHLSARLELDLLDAGQQVVRVPPKMMAEQRRVARTRGKSDPIDALAVARAVLREPDLPAASHDEASREVKLLVDHREDLVRQRTAIINRLRWHLHRIDPALDPAPQSLDRASTRARLAEFLTGIEGIDARLARELLDDVAALTARADALAKEIAQLADQLAPELLELPGCGPLTAAKILGETAGIGRFAHEAKYAMHAGVAPIPVWSGRTAGKVRLNKSGNRQLNAALHRIAVTQIRLGGLGKAYYDKRLAAGDSKTEALRCLKRRLARVVFNTLKNAQQAAAAAQYATAA
ncbi:IS110 family transposase [Isoptericola variabilis]|uniref:Transposase IS116/IS110/IS902 family protein n=1 Tax=Isoptericola variabilis (strain 225) TaxID=743718 RepID=F6FRQ2_ISOV2|nr:IS110 family transposase [Isoptericola variabilis]AEG42993.1 transposase IS116/IS110/IS902 family protein [Isoptericola variabilis 225]